MYYNNQMLEIKFPGQRTLSLATLVCDINGTLTLDGQLIAGVKDAIDSLRTKLDIHLLSADTLGRAEAIATSLNIRLQKVEPGKEDKQKAEYIEKLGKGQTAVIGQGANDALMLKLAALGICVLSTEGTAVPALLAADLVVPDILTAFALLQNPMRLVATLRK
jgi:P-type E1-E2 ATPase